MKSLFLKMYHYCKSINKIGIFVYSIFLFIPIIAAEIILTIYGTKNNWANLTNIIISLIFVPFIIIFLFNSLRRFTLKIVESQDCFFASCFLVSFVLGFINIPIFHIFSFYNSQVLYIVYFTLSGFFLMIVLIRTIISSKVKEVEKEYNLADLYKGNNVGERLVIKDSFSNLDIFGLKIQKDSLLSYIKNSSSCLPAYIHVCGEWGIGKTTFINMVISELEPEKYFIINDFNFWSYDDKESILKGIIKIIVEKLHIPINSYTLEKILANIIGIIFDKDTFSSLEVFEDCSNNLDELTIEINKRTFKKPLIFIIDDIDRMDDELIKFLFKAIFSILKMHNIFYILLYDKNNITEDKIKFLEKTKNFELFIPNMITDRFAGPFITCFKNRCKDFGFAIDCFPNLIELANNFPIFDTPRSMVSFFNSFYNFRILLDNFNLCPEELFLVGILRIRDEKIIRILRDESQILLSKKDLNYFEHSRINENSSEEDELNRIMSSFSKVDSTIIYILFPNIRDYIHDIYFDVKQSTKNNNYSHIYDIRNLDFYLNFSPTHYVEENSKIDDEINHALSNGKLPIEFIERHLKNWNMISRISKRLYKTPIDKASLNYFLKRYDDIIMNEDTIYHEDIENIKEIIYACFVSIGLDACLKYLDNMKRIPLFQYIYFKYDDKDMLAINIKKSIYNLVDKKVVKNFNPYRKNNVYIGISQWFLRNHKSYLKKIINDKPEYVYYFLRDCVIIGYKGNQFCYSLNLNYTAQLFDKKETEMVVSKVNSKKLSKDGLIIKRLVKEQKYLNASLNLDIKLALLHLFK